MVLTDALKNSPVNGAMRYDENGRAFVVGKSNSLWSFDATLPSYVLYPMPELEDASILEKMQLLEDWKPVK